MEFVRVDKNEYEALKKLRESNNRRVKKFLQGKKKIQVIVTERERAQMLEYARSRGFSSIQRMLLAYMRQCIANSAVLQKHDADMLTANAQQTGDSAPDHV